MISFLRANLIIDTRITYIFIYPSIRHTVKFKNNDSMTIQIYFKENDKMKRAFNCFHSK